MSSHSHLEYWGHGIEIFVESIRFAKGILLRPSSDCVGG